MSAEGNPVSGSDPHEEPARSRRVENRLGDDEARTRPRLALEHLDLVREILAVRVRDRARIKRRQRFEDFLSLTRVSAIEHRNHLEQSEGVEVVHGAYAIRITGRDLVAGQCDDAINSKRPGAEQIGFERKAVAVAAGEVEHYRNSKPRLDERGEYQRGHLDTAKRVVRQIDRIDLAAQRG